MDYPNINTHDLKVVYNTITAKMNLCIDSMTAAINNEDLERYVALADQYKRIRVMRTHYLQKIDVLKEILEEVLNIAEEVRKI